MKTPSPEKTLEKLAKQMAAKTRNDNLDDPTSPGFIRLMMYSCMFLAASSQCKGVPCDKCKATQVIENGLKKHPELLPDYEAMKDIRKKGVPF